MKISIAWGAKVSIPFIQKVVDICNEFSWYEGAHDDIMGCMAFESGETFSPSVRNAAGSGATGLIQFMPSTVAQWGVTTDQLADMNAVEQLDYVQRYFKPYAQRIKSISDMYMAILLPKYVGADDSAKLFTEGTVAYRQNSGLDANKDGIITKLEATRLVIAKRDKGKQPGLLYDGEI